ncbi:uncharacterized protein ACNS7B_021618 isoform 2-T2 [Menidia menidia]
MTLSVAQMGIFSICASHDSCDVEANFNKISQSWVLSMSEFFILNVTQAADGEHPDLTGYTPGPGTASSAGHSPEGGQGGLTRGRPGLVVVAVAVLLLYPVYRGARAMKSFWLSRKCWWPAPLRRSSVEETLKFLSCE